MGWANVRANMRANTKLKGFATTLLELAIIFDTSHLPIILGAANNAHDLPMHLRNARWECDTHQ